MTSKIACTHSGCKTSMPLPEKRDFMDILPEKTALDFYRNYDWTVGVGTALILLLFILIITVKSITRYIWHQWLLFRYKRTLFTEISAEKQSLNNISENVVESCYEFTEAQKQQRRENSTATNLRVAFLNSNQRPVVQAATAFYS